MKSYKTPLLASRKEYLGQALVLLKIIFFLGGLFKYIFFFCIFKCFASGRCSANSRSKALTNVIFVSAGCAAGSIFVVRGFITRIWKS